MADLIMCREHVGRQAWPTGAATPRAPLLSTASGQPLTSGGTATLSSHRMSATSVSCCANLKPAGRYRGGVDGPLDGHGAPAAQQ